MSEQARQGAAQGSLNQKTLWKQKREPRLPFFMHGQISAIPGTIQQFLGGDNILRQRSNRQRVGLELAHRLQRRIVGHDAGHHRPFIIAVGEIALRLVAGQILDRKSVV